MSPEESLHDTYLKAKRYLTFFAAALLLSVSVGFAPTGESTLLPWKISDPQHVSLVLYAVVIYYLCQISLFWDAQGQPVKSRLQHSFDYLLSVGIGFMALYSLPIRLTVHNLTSFKIEKISAADFLIDWWTVAALAAVPPVALFLYRAVLRPSIKKSRTKEEVQTEATTKALLGSQWELVFNPQMYKETNEQRGSKTMEFDPQGRVVRGQNQNEATWQVNAGFLELFNINGKLYSRFRLSPDGARFDHTNDQDTFSLRDQYMLRTAHRGHPYDGPAVAELDNVVPPPPTS